MVRMDWKMEELKPVCKTARTMKIVILLSCIMSLSGVKGHGRLMEPPARNAMWRYGYPNPVNYNDNELFCGGFIVHYQQNNGKCGVCGDNYKNKEPRAHEAGGIFGNGITVRRFAMGQEITITADLTTNHKGWMEVKLCPNNDPRSVATQSCLDKYPLKVVGGQDHRFIIPQNSSKVEVFTWTVKLPDFLTCSQCVIQWTYFAGNTWGGCSDGSEGVGCGDQETFINCADVEIYSNTPNVPQNLIDNPWLLYYRANDSPVGVSNAIDPTFSLRPLVVSSQLCIPVGDYVEIEGMNDWCRVNCLKYPPNCHPEACKCVHECKAIGTFARERDADVFCHQNCLKYPSHCPKERCHCF